MELTLFLLSMQVLVEVKLKQMLTSLRLIMFTVRQASKQR
jgi:hypothetical protein